ncbi:MAG: nickel-type superoxide dismutase maturation protease [Nitriliruptoraceae bacterium]
MLAGLVVADLLAVAVNRSLVRVEGPSMEPSLRAGDVLLTVPASRRMLRPGRVVVVADPTQPGHLVVKRVRRVRPSGIEVLGDLAERSTDSRQWGPLPPGAIRRVVLARWPDVRSPVHHRPELTSD